MSSCCFVCFSQSYFHSDLCVIIVVLEGEMESKKLFCGLKALDIPKMPSVLLVPSCLKLYLNWGLVMEDKKCFLQQGMHELYDKNKLLQTA